MKLTTFDNLSGVPCHYARTNKAYADLTKCTKSRKRKLAPGFLNQLEACILELKWLTYPIMGEMTAITSGGAYVPLGGKRKIPDCHTMGKAYDIGGIHWRFEYPLVCLDVARQGRHHEDYELYLGCEAIFRRHFGTVLGLHYNKNHWNHWHIDSGTKVGYLESSYSRVKFLQASLSALWGMEDLEVDGKAGPQTKEAIRAIRDHLHLEPLTKQSSWLQYLLLTAMNVFV